MHEVVQNRDQQKGHGELMEPLGRDGNKGHRRGKEPELVLVASENKRLQDKQKSSTLISAVQP